MTIHALTLIRGSELINKAGVFEKSYCKNFKKCPLTIIEINKNCGNAKLVTFNGSTAIGSSFSVIQNTGFFQRGTSWPQ